MQKLNMDKKFEEQQLKTLEFLNRFFKKHKIEWMIHAGFSLYLRKIGGDNYDIDIVLLNYNLKKLFKLLPLDTFSKQLLSPPVLMSKGIYDNPRIILKHFYLNIDICSKIVTIIGRKRYKIPYDKDAFNHKSFIHYKGMKLPIASAEDVLIYKYVHNRSENGKADMKDVLSIKNKIKLDLDHLEKQANKLGIKKEILKVLKKS